MSMQAEWASGNQRNTLTVHLELVFGLASFPGVSRKQKTRPKQLGRVIRYNFLATGQGSSPKIVKFWPATYTLPLTMVGTVNLTAVPK